jgi:hypothetical protein
MMGRLYHEQEQLFYEFARCQHIELPTTRSICLPNNQNGADCAGTFGGTERDRSPCRSICIEFIHWKSARQ